MRPADQDRSGPSAWRRPRRPLALLAGGLLGAAALCPPALAAGAATASPSPSAAAGVALVTFNGQTFSPNPMELSPGEKVSFHNTSLVTVTLTRTTSNWSLAVTLTAGAQSVDYGPFPGGTYGFQSDPSLFVPQVAGSLRVAAAASSSPSPSASPTPPARSPSPSPRPSGHRTHAPASPSPSAGSASATLTPAAPPLALGFNGTVGTVGPTATPAPPPPTVLQLVDGSGVVAASPTPTPIPTPSPAATPSVSPEPSVEAAAPASLSASAPPNRGLGLAEVIAGILAAGVLAGWLRTLRAQRPAR